MAPPTSVPAPTATLGYSVSKGFEMKLISQCALVVVTWSAVWWDSYRTHSCKSLHNYEIIRFLLLSIALIGHPLLLLDPSVSVCTTICVYVMGGDETTANIAVSLELMQ